MKPKTYSQLVREAEQPPLIVIDLLKQEIKANTRLTAKVKKLSDRIGLLELYVMNLQNAALKQGK